MTAYDRLDLLFQQNNGIVKTAQVLEIGIAKSTFYAYAKQHGVEQAAHGVYVVPDAWMDAMYLLHLRCAQAVGLQHCKCGMSWKKDEGFFERTPDMIFALERRTIGGKVKQVPIIRYQSDK